MKLTGGRVSRFLEKPPEDIIGVLFFGPDRGLVKTRSEALINVWSSDPKDAFSTTILTADDLSSDPARLSDEMSALSLLGDSRLIRVRLDHERSGAALSKIIKALDTHPEKAAARLIVEAGDMTTRSAVRKSFEAAGHFASIGCYPLGRADLANMVRSELSRKNIVIHPDALDLWLPLLEGDHVMLQAEIDKMMLYKGYGEVTGAAVSVEDVRQTASGGQTASIDDIIMSAMSGDTSLCDDAYRRAISGKVNTAVILRALQRHIGRLLEASMHIQAGERPEGAIKSLRPPVFRMQERAFLGQLRLWSRRALENSLAQSLVTEQRLKSAASPGDALVGHFLLKLAGFAEKRK